MDHPSTRNKKASNPKFYPADRGTFLYTTLHLKVVGPLQDNIRAAGSTWRYWQGVDLYRNYAKGLGLVPKRCIKMVPGGQNDTLIILGWSTPGDPPKVRVILWAWNWKDALCFRLWTKRGSVDDFCFFLVSFTGLSKWSSLCFLKPKLDFLPQAQLHRRGKLIWNLGCRFAAAGPKRLFSWGPNSGLTMQSFLLGHWIEVWAIYLYPLRYVRCFPKMTRLFFCVFFSWSWHVWSEFP